MRRVGKRYANLKCSAFWKSGEVLRDMELGRDYYSGCRQMTEYRRQCSKCSISEHGVRGEKHRWKTVGILKLMSNSNGMQKQKTAKLVTLQIKEKFIR